jgi:hypothetical protein
MAAVQLTNAWFCKTDSGVQALKPQSTMRHDRFYRVVGTGIGITGQRRTPISPVRTQTRVCRADEHTLNSLLAV